ncbi:helix-turn-helix transcriptional regulator [Methylovorus sp. SPW-M1]
MKTISLPDTGFLRIRQVLEFIPISQAAWWLGVADGKYPKGIKLAPRTTVWRAEDIRNLINEIGNRAA